MELAVGTIEQAVEAVEAAAPEPSANEVVADALLRAKVNECGDTQPSSRVVLQSCNPGSLGHPELCQRPCLYCGPGEPSGVCGNGNDCDFCHLPHPKRPVHLDKRHREILKKLPPDQVTSWILQILWERIEEIGLLTQEVRDRLRLIEMAMIADITASCPNKCMRTFLTVLRAMSVRSLLMMLSRSATTSECGTMIEFFLEQLRDMSRHKQHACLVAT